MLFLDYLTARKFAVFQAGAVFLFRRVDPSKPLWRELRYSEEDQVSDSLHYYMEDLSWRNTVRDLPVEAPAVLIVIVILSTGINTRGKFCEGSHTRP